VRIQLAAMDRWKPFRTSLRRHTPQARVIFDTCHIMRHLGDALDAVRRREYRRLAAKDRAFIKGQRYTLLSHREHLSLDDRRSLAKLLKESFGQLWNYQTEGGARAPSSGGHRALRGSGSPPTRRSQR
jgi:transposase